MSLEAAPDLQVRVCKNCGKYFYAPGDADWVLCRDCVCYDMYGSIITLIKLLEKREEVKDK